MIASVVAILIIIKILVMATGKNRWQGVTSAVYGNQRITGFVFAILAIIVFYYLTLEMTIVQIMAASAFMALIMGLGFISFGKDFMTFVNKMYKKKIPGLIWIISLVWVILSVWTLYVVFF